MFSEACAQLQTWREQGLGLDDFTMSVNLSSRHFETAGLTAMIAGVVEQAEIDPKWLHLEITESMLMGRNESIISNFEGLKRIGIKFSLDDFGTGYSSLGYLRHFPIDLLKIDRTFIHDLPENADNAAIVATIIALANSLNLTRGREGGRNRGAGILPERTGLPLCAGFPVQPAFAAGSNSCRCCWKGGAWVPRNRHSSSPLPSKRRNGTIVPPACPVCGKVPDMQDRLHPQFPARSGI